MDSRRDAKANHEIEQTNNELPHSYFERLRCDYLRMMSGPFHNGLRESVSLTQLA